MAWLRIGDNITTHPAMSRILSATAPDDQPLKVSHEKKLAAVGALVLLASASGAHLTDGWIEIGHIAQIAPGMETEILDILEGAGIAERVKTVDPTGPADVTPRWMIQIDLSDPEFMHIRKREEVMIDRRRKQDSRDEDLIMPVRVRDGDECRWCGKTVDWKARRGNRAGHIDSMTAHVDSTIETLVVSCHRCNDRRSKGETLTLRNSPKIPYYTEHTLNFVNKSQWAKDNQVHIEPRQTRIKITDQDDAPQQQADEAAADTGKAAHPTTAAAPHEAAAPGQAAPASAAPDRQEAQGGTAPGDSSLSDAPWWVFADDEETAEQMRAQMRQQTTPPAAGTGMAAATPGGAAPVREAPAGEAAPAPSSPPSTTKDNETVKPGPDLGRQGDESGSVGTGRAGQGRDEQGRDGPDTEPRRKRRRGKRGGRRK